jgi:hypothetical protein
MTLSNLIYCTMCDAVIDVNEKFILTTKVPTNYIKQDGLDINNSDESIVLCVNCSIKYYGIDLNKKTLSQKKRTDAQAKSK